MRNLEKKNELREHRKEQRENKAKCIILENKIVEQPSDNYIDPSLIQKKMHVNSEKSKNLRKKIANKKKCCDKTAYLESLIQKKNYKIFNKI